MRASLVVQDADDGMGIQRSACAEEEDRVHHLATNLFDAISQRER